MNKKNGPSLGHNKKSLLKSEIEHIDITSFDARKIIESIIFLESKDVISMCSTSVFNNDFLLCPTDGPFFLFIMQLSI